MSFTSNITQLFVCRSQLSVASICRDGEYWSQVSEKITQLKSKLAGSQQFAAAVAKPEQQTSTRRRRRQALILACQVTAVYERITTVVQETRVWLRERVNRREEKRGLFFFSFLNKFGWPNKVMQEENGRRMLFKVLQQRQKLFNQFWECRVVSCHFVSYISFVFLWCTIERMNERTKQYQLWATPQGLFTVRLFQ